MVLFNLRGCTNSRRRDEDLKVKTKEMRKFEEKLRKVTQCRIALHRYQHSVDQFQPVSRCSLVCADHKKTPPKMALALCERNNLENLILKVSRYAKSEKQDIIILRFLVMNLDCFWRA